MRKPKKEAKLPGSPTWVKDHDEVRLFSSVHIRGDEEAELRATASLLAAIRGVSEFGRKIVRLSNGPAGRLSCYTEIPFDFVEDGEKIAKSLRPDGVIISTRGKSQWVAFVEVKVGTATLNQGQIDKYQKLVRQEGAHALITVSNQAARADGSPPLNIDRRRTPIVHFSWERLLSVAQDLSRKKLGIADVDQKWILDEWIRYVDDEDSRIVVPPDLGPKWSEVLRAARANKLERLDGELENVARYWLGYLRKAAFRLQAKLGVDVKVRMSRKERENTKLQAQNSVNAQEGTLTGALRIPDAAGDISIEVDLRSRMVRYILSVAAPTEGQQKTRVRWLYRQLRAEENLPDGDLKAIVDWSVRGLSTAAQIGDYLDDPTMLCKHKDGIPVDSQAQPRTIRVVLTRSLGSGRGRSSAPILAGISQGLENFYDKVVQNIKPFVPKPPRLAISKQEQEGSGTQEDDSDNEVSEAE